MRKFFLAVSVLILPAAGGFTQQAVSPHFPPIAELLGTPSADALPGAEDLRDSLGSQPDFKQTIRALTSLNEGRRRRAVRLLGKKGNLRAIPYLSAVLLRSNADPKTRADAAMALGKIEHWRAMETLKESMGDPSVNVRFATALAVGKIQADDAVSLLESTALRDAHWWVRYSAAVALGESSDPAAVGALAKVLSEDLRWQVRQQAARSLARFKGKHVIGILGNALGDQDPSVRYGAAKALGEIGGMDSLDPLHAALQTERDPLARAAIRASIKTVVNN